jgi:hypothetical protein
LALMVADLGCDDSRLYEAGTLVHLQGNIKKLSAPDQSSECVEFAGDPCVIKDGAVYRIFYTGLDKVISGGGIGSADSSNGMDWAIIDVPYQRAGKGLVLRGVSNTWQHQLETELVAKHEDMLFLYYCGYPKIGWPKNPGQLGVAVSHDGVRFERPSPDLILTPSPDGYDANGLYSPSVIYDGAQFVMVYAGHCYPSEYANQSNKWRATTSEVTPGIYLLGATSSNGLSWTKRREPVLSPSPDPSWMVNGVAEPDLIKVPDGKYYLFFTGNLGDDEARLIGIARSDTALGPWRVRQEPLLTGTANLFDRKSVLAPSVRIEGDTLRLWYLTSDADGHMTGYAEIPWPRGEW